MVVSSFFSYGLLEQKEKTALLFLLFNMVQLNMLFSRQPADMLHNQSVEDFPSTL
jgi:hypothetical protein